MPLRIVRWSYPVVLDLIFQFLSDVVRLASQLGKLLFERWVLHDVGGANAWTSTLKFNETIPNQILGRTSQAPSQFQPTVIVVEKGASKRQRKGVADFPA